MDKEWWDSANCATTNPEVMFPYKGRSAELARKICSECTVIQECLADALTAPEQYGFAGGLTAKARRKILSIE